ncbi:glycosyltransferase, partial [Fretibacterium fastidiosum]
MVRLAGLLAQRGFAVDVVVPAPQSDAMKAGVPKEVALVELDGGHYFESLRLFHRIFKTKNIFLLPWAFVVFFWKLFVSTRSLTRYIGRRRPDLLLTAHYNAMTLTANFLAGRPSRVVVTEHTLLSEHLRRQVAPVRVCFSTMCRLF